VLEDLVEENLETVKNFLDLLGLDSLEEILIEVLVFNPKELI
jgi:hypothetical protein